MGAMPAPRWDMAREAQFALPIYAVGGHDGRSARAEVWRTDSVWLTGESAPAWHEERPLPAPRRGATIAHVANGLVVAGGWGPDGRATSEAWWAPMDQTEALGPWVDLPALPGPRSGHVLLAFEEAVWLLGGMDEFAQPASGVWRLAWPGGTAWEARGLLPVGGEVQVAVGPPGLLLVSEEETWASTMERVAAGQPWLELPAHEHHLAGDTLLYSGSHFLRLGGVDAGEPSRAVWSLEVCYGLLHFEGLL